jgi:hypothetical protein
MLNIFISSAIYVFMPFNVHAVVCISTTDEEMNKEQ